VGAAVPPELAEMVELPLFTVELPGFVVEHEIKAHARGDRARALIVCHVTVFMLV
jgi:hypothetical protein